MEFPLSDFCITKLSFFDSDFNDAGSSVVKLNDECTLSLILALKVASFDLWHPDFVRYEKEIQKEVKNQNILIHQVK